MTALAIRLAWATVFPVTGIVLLPLRVAAATLPAFVAYDAAGSSATTRMRGETSVPRERGAAVKFSYDEAIDRYDCSTKEVPLSVSVEGGTAPSTTRATACAAKGGWGSTARASSPPNDHHVFPQEFRKWFSGRGVDIR